MAPPDSGAHVWLSRAAAWAVRGGGVHGSGSSHEAAPLSARMAPAARRTDAMAPVAKGDPRGRPRVDPGCRNLTQSPPLEFGPEAAMRQALRKHYASAKLKLTNTIRIHITMATLRHDPPAPPPGRLPPCLQGRRWPCHPPHGHVHEPPGTRAPPSELRGHHLSNTTCLTHVFFKRIE